MCIRQSRLFRGAPRRKVEDMLDGLSKALNRLFCRQTAPSPRRGGSAMSMEVRCEKCGELIPVRIDKDLDLQAEYEDDAPEGARPTAYVLRKEVVGAKCQNLIRFTIRFDEARSPVEYDIEGGEFVEPEQEQ